MKIKLITLAGCLLITTHAYASCGSCQANSNPCGEPSINRCKCSDLNYNSNPCMSVNDYCKAFGNIGELDADP